MAIKSNLFIDQGTDYSTSINLTDDDDNIVSLTGYTAQGQIRKTYSSSTSVSFTVSITAATGTVTLQLTAVQTANIVAGRYVYDVFVTDSGNTTSRILEGIVTITPRVTR
jgi:hypothetical protein